MVRRQKINTITNLGIKNWNDGALIPDSVFEPYLPKNGGQIKSSDFNVLFKLLQTGVNALNLHIFRSFIFNLTTANVAVSNVTDESLSGSATFQDLINKENKIRIVLNTQNIITNARDIEQNTLDIEDLQNADNIVGNVLYYNGTDTIGTEIRNQNSASVENLGFYLTFYKNRNETVGGNYLSGDTRYFIQLSSAAGAISYCQNFTAGNWVATDCPYTDSRTIVIKKTLDSALSNKVDKAVINETLNEQGEFNYDDEASPSVKKTDLTNDNYTELRILTDGAHLIKNDVPYIAETDDEIVVKSLLDTNIAPINSDINAIENVNDNQNIRLNLIEQTLAQAASDFAYLKQTTSVQATTINKYIAAPIVSGFEFDSDYISYDNTTDPTVGKFTLTRNAKIIFDFVGNVSRDATDTLTLIYEIWDLDSATVLASDTTTFDFTTQSTIFNQGGIISYSFQNIDGTTVTARNFAIRFRVSTGTLTASQFKMPVNVIFKSSSDVVEVLTFADILNDTNVAGADGQIVINNLNTNVLSNTTNIDSLTSSKADKTTVNAALDTKLTKKQTVLDNTGRFGYTDGANSPYLEKYDLATDHTTRLIVFANQNPVIQMLEGTTETSGTYTPTAINELIIKGDLDKAEDRINDKIEPLETQVDENTVDIDANTASINTLTTLIQQNFTDSGVYTSPSGVLNSESGEVRVELTAVTPLDPTYVSVSVDPNDNLFINHFDGNINFIVQFDGIQNDDVQKTLALKIYDNQDDTIIKTITKVIPVGAYITTNFFGALEVAEGDEVYFTYSISDGAGDLTISNNVVYNIEIQSSSNLVAVKSSQVINDKLDVTNAGINADLNQIYTNRSDIIVNTNGITDNAIAITGLDSRVTINETNIVENTTKINTNISDIIDLNDAIDRIDTEVLLASRYMQGAYPHDIDLTELWTNFKQIYLSIEWPSGPRTTEIVLTSEIFRETVNYDLYMINEPYGITIRFYSTKDFDQVQVYSSNPDVNIDLNVYGLIRLSPAEAAARVLKKLIKERIEKMEKKLINIDDEHIIYNKGIGYIQVPQNTPTDEIETEIGLADLYNRVYTNGGTYTLTKSNFEALVSGMYYPSSYFQNNTPYWYILDWMNVWYIQYTQTGSPNEVTAVGSFGYSTVVIDNTMTNIQSIVEEWQRSLLNTGDAFEPCTTSSNRLCGLVDASSIDSLTTIIDFTKVGIIEGTVKPDTSGTVISVDMYSTDFDHGRLLWSGDVTPEHFNHLIEQLPNASSVLQPEGTQTKVVFNLNWIIAITYYTYAKVAVYGKIKRYLTLDTALAPQLISDWTEFLTAKGRVDQLFTIPDEDVFVFDMSKAAAVDDTVIYFDNLDLPKYNHGQTLESMGELLTAPSAVYAGRIYNLDTITDIQSPNVVASTSPALLYFGNNYSLMLDTSTITNLLSEWKGYLQIEGDPIDVYSV